ncbi:TM2 domain-containing protein 1 [Sander lucioperca]|uniref:TM2 domain containing 1 n=1 Tax=Sander lucioperca TaxID=283035 RepID=A0A8D0AKW7_SANLU|nr:TM2 domain-containing protein 1 [Sander lucioperca]XP_031179956.1 TM2 domain-containing protein 1 [Sander lucioperca]XP_031179957.1 TM2 domain-containing protein 1 [Sander lucioperca]
MASSWRRLLCLRSGIWSLLFYCVYSHLKLVLSEEVDTCDNLSLGQYRCNNPKIDDATQEPENCRDTTAWVECLPAPNISCRLSNGTEFRFSGEEVGFNKTIPCRNVSGYSYKVAVALSLFLGWLGADRFYLGYPALGLLKFCTVGFCGIGTLIDFILIAMQIVGPADGSSYIVDYYGARLTRLSITNQTYRKPHLAL